jgi:homoserine dehydrogenase
LASISDSSASVYPKGDSQVLEAIKWKEESKTQRLASLSQLTRNNETLHGLEHSSASIVVDVTNSDYAKPEEAKKRAIKALDLGKHFVSANKVAFAYYFDQVMEHARKRGLEVGFGATICGARHAVRVAQSLGPEEIQTAHAVLNASTTFILSKIEESPDLSFDKACTEADKAGILESDWSIDLDGVDAAAKTAILANVLFPESHVSINDVVRKGIRDKAASTLIDSLRKERISGNIEHTLRLVSEISRNNSVVSPMVLKRDSPLAVQGRYNTVSFNTSNLGDISIQSLGGGVSLTSSVLLSDINEIASRKISSKP